MEGCDFYVRMVRSVTTSSRKVIGISLILSELQTLLVKKEAIINSRPLAYIYSELNPVFLHLLIFLIGKRILCLPNIKAKNLVLPEIKESLMKRFHLRETSKSLLEELGK